MSAKFTLIPEWEKQDAIIISWPHADTDWAYILDEIDRCYIDIASQILRFEDLIILTPEKNRVKELITDINRHGHNCLIVEIETNDTWIRDYGPLSFVLQDEQSNGKAITDFTFNGWGMKFAANKDNLITRCLYLSRLFDNEVHFINRLILVLEGGSVESDGKGTILSSEGCLMELNRNAGFEQPDLKDLLANSLGADRLLLLKNGWLEGDDTDGHIDTLARFINPHTIAYVSCTDIYDSHYHELKRMEEELTKLQTYDGKCYDLVPLPHPSAIYDEAGERLPATYANFLFVNDAILLPIYNQESDAIAISQMKKACPDRVIVPIDCNTLIRQHGSLHCMTMQIPQGFINKNKLQ